MFQKNGPNLLKHGFEILNCSSTYVADRTSDKINLPLNIHFITLPTNKNQTSVHYLFLLVGSNPSLYLLKKYG